jgi:23S rRNA (adenine2503-C2)-methyltransferase
MAYLIPPEELGSLLNGHPPYRSEQLRQWLYEHPVLEAADMTNLPGEVRAGLSETLWPFVVDAEQTGDAGRTRKWLFRCDKDAAIEAVLMGYPKRVTLCLSSQAGCAMGCTFCATGQFGFDRQLDAGEIVAQVAYAQAHLRAHPLPDSPDRLSNIVFMGMGEPLANYANVREALRRMIEVMHIGARHITVSTVGITPGIRKLADEPWQVGLALSLHAADDELRETLVPINRRYPIRDLVDACAYYFEKKGRRVSIEWTMMEGTNDTPEQAAKLATIARELRAHVNVINLNPTPLSAERPSDTLTVEDFIADLRSYGVAATFRETRGQDIDAACGQLRSLRFGDAQTKLSVPSVTKTNLGAVFKETL